MHERGSSGIQSACFERKTLCICFRLMCPAKVRPFRTSGLNPLHQAGVMRWDALMAARTAAKHRKLRTSIIVAHVAQQTGDFSAPLLLPGA